MKIRPAEHHDVHTIVRIIAHYASQGLMLPRSHGAMAANLPHYLVADLDGQVIGCGGLEPYSADVAEIYGLATAPGSSARGTGSAIVQALIEKARSDNLSKVLLSSWRPVFSKRWVSRQSSTRTCL